MSALLFQLEESLSPRMAWMREHGIAVIDNNLCVQVEAENKEWRQRAFCAYQGERNADGLFVWDETGWGDTENDALMDLASTLGISTWLLV